MTRSYRFLNSALVVVLALPLVASAAGKDKKSKKTPPSAVDSQPAPPSPVAKKDPKKAEERTGPASFNATNGRPGQQSEEDAKREELADQKRDQEIAELKNVIRQVPADSTQKADLIFQLAELYYEKNKYIYSKEMRSYFKAQDDVAAKRDKGEKAEDPKLDTKDSDLWRGEALRLYQQILKEYPTYERKDEVLFTLAYNQYEDAKTKATAIQNYFTLIKQFPNSKYVPDAYVQLGEHFFNSNDLDKARKSYTEALKSQNPKIHNFALYKLAWCDFNSGDYDGSIKKFKQVIEATRSGDKKDNDRIQLKNEALNDIVTPFVQIEATDEAIGYFEAQTTKKKAHGLTKKLADNLEGAGKHDAAIKVYRTLIAKDPNDTDAPIYQQAIVSAYEQLRRRDLVAKEMQVLVSTYGPKSQWAQINKDNKSAMASAYEATEGAMRKMVTEYHQEAQRTKDVATYKLARDIYKQYVDNFGDSEYAFNLRFYYAEILFTLQEWEPAAEQYEQVVTANPGEYGTKSYKKSAAYDVILCYENLVKGKSAQLKDTDKIDEKQSKGVITKQTIHIEKGAEAQKEEEIPKWEKKLADACDKYVQVVPNDPDEISVRYKAAFIYYTHHHDIDAANRFGDIINKWPTDKFSRQAADFTLNILENKKQWGDLNRLSRGFLANKKLAGGDKEFAGRLAKIVEGSQYNVDEELYKVQKKPAEAAVAFREFVKEFPKSPYAPQALLYSMIIFQDANQLDQGIVVGEQLLKDYGDSPLVPQTHLNLAYYYAKTAQYPHSAKAYEAYVKLWEKAHGIVDDAKGGKGKKGAPAKATAKAEKKGAKDGKPDDKNAAVAELDKNVADALFNAALYHEGLGEDETAIAEYTKYIDYTEQKKPGFTKNDAPEVFLGIARIHEKAKNNKAIFDDYDQYVTRFGKQVTADKVYLAKHHQLVALREMHPPTTNGNKLTEDRDVQKLLTELLQGFGKLDDKAKQNDLVIDAYGHAKFLAAEPLWREYTAVNFKDARHVLQDLKAKIKLLDQVKSAYTGVVEARSGEWAIAALTRLGLGYEDFARGLLDSPDPKGLNDDQLQMYRAELENKAFPYEDKAVEFLETALAKSSELRLYSEWSTRAQDQMNKIKPGAFGEARQVAYRGSEFFATAPALTSDVALPKAEQPAPAPTPSTPPAPTAKPAAGAGAGSN